VPRDRGEEGYAGTEHGAHAVSFTVSFTFFFPIDETERRSCQCASVVGRGGEPNPTELPSLVRQ